MKTNSESFEKSKILKICVEFETNIRIKTLRNDSSVVSFCQMIFLCEEHGIQQKFTTMNTPHQNGVAKKKKIGPF
jgi:hypothetical protein